MFAALSVISHWRSPALTWCRTLFIRRQRRTLVLTQISRNFSNYDERFGFNGESATTSTKYTDKRQRRHGIASKQDSRGQSKLFKQRVVSESDKQAEQEDADMLRNLPESSRFGTGVGQFVEISQACTKQADQDFDDKEEGRYNRGSIQSRRTDSNRKPFDRDNSMSEGYNRRPDHYDNSSERSNRRPDSYDNNSTERYNRRPNRYDNNSSERYNRRPDRYDNNSSERYNRRPDCYDNNSSERYNRRPDRYDNNSSERYNRRPDRYDNNSSERYTKRPGHYDNSSERYNRRPDHYDNSRSEGYNGRPENKKSWKSADWVDTFGTLLHKGQGRVKESTLAHNEKYMDELEEEEKTAKFYNHIRLARYNRRHIPNWYARKMEHLGKKGQVREAIKVFDKWMIEQDRVKPTSYEFGILIKLLARVGYTKKAFQLYNQMLAMKIYYPHIIFTSLFNACANSPFPENGLRLANKLHSKMLVKGIRPNYITYLAMIKAYGMNGDINKAFSLADEAAQLHFSDDLLNNMLIGCISDKEAGFRHAIMVWRKFRRMRIQPSLKSYNLLLRAVRECGIGDPKLVNKLLGEAGGTENVHMESTESIRLLEAVGQQKESSYDLNTETDQMIREQNQRKKTDSFKEIDEVLSKYVSTGEETDIIDLSDEEHAGNEKLDIPENKDWWELDIFETSVKDLVLRNSEQERVDVEEANLPDILDPNENFTSVIQIEAVKNEMDRLALLGGMKGFLQTLKQRKIKPNIITYTQLSQVVPDHLVDRVLDEMWAANLPPDIDFYTQLIRRKVRYDKDGAWALYRRLKHEELSPTVYTYSALALACNRREDGMKLLDDMAAADIMPEYYTMGSLLCASHFDFNYKKEMLRRMQELGIHPSVGVIEIVEKQINVAKTDLAAMEKGEYDGRIKNPKLFGKQLASFVHFYDKWSQYNSMDEPQHPWKSFIDQKTEDVK